jgi:hypothetical protein
MQARALAQLGHEVLVIAGAPPGFTPGEAEAAAAAHGDGSAGGQQHGSQTVLHVSFNCLRSLWFAAVLRWPDSLQWRADLVMPLHGAG